MAIKIRESLLKLLNFLPVASSSTTPLAHYGLLNDNRDHDIESFYEHMVSTFIRVGHDILLPVTEVLFIKQYQQVSKHEYLSVAVETMDGPRYILLERRNGGANEHLPRHPPVTGIADGPPTGLSQASSSANCQPQSEQVPTAAATHGQPQDPPPTDLPQTATVGIVDPAPTSPRHDPALAAPRRLTFYGTFIAFTRSIFSSDSKPARVASDSAKIRSNPKHDEQDSIIGRLECEGSINLHMLIIIALMVHDSDLSYELWGSNCFWFAGAITAIIEQKTKRKMVQLDPGVTNPFMRWLRRKSEPKGKFLRFTIFARPAKETLEKAVVDLGVYEERFSNKVNEGQRPLIESRKRTIKAEEETARCREEMARLREETARFREETARLREETARFREETARLREETARFREETARLREETARFREETARFREETARFREETARLREETARSREEMWIQFPTMRVV